MKDKERYLIDTFQSKYIGDDGAIVGEYIYSVDAFCEDIHFRREWMSPFQIGRKAMLVNISDAVAMNAAAKYALLSVSLPQNFTLGEIDQLTDGLKSAARQWDCEIIGGDTVGGEKLNISITLVSQSSDPLFRKAIEEGDLLAYTGTLGESRKALMALEAGRLIQDDSRFYEPTLRADFINRARQYIRAGMDISDGLFCDTNKLLDANKYGFEILKNIDDETGLSGEEYEMLIAVNPIFRNMIDKIAIETGTKITYFARVATNSRRYTCHNHHFN
jgi:thiamine-monophosphate kinase